VSVKPWTPTAVRTSRVQATLGEASRTRGEPGCEVFPRQRHYIWWIYGGMGGGEDGMGGDDVSGFRIKPITSSCSDYDWQEVANQRLPIVSA
jgi:hypothetical protein